MKAFFLASFLVVAVVAVEDHAALFQSFKAAHGKTYSNQVEETTRFNIFKQNLKDIEEHNALYAQGLVSYNKSVNQFTDMTEEEFKALLTLHAKPTLNSTPYVKIGAAVPDSLDLRTSGYVTGVKNQGNCGSCWAFSLTGSTEGAYFKKHNKLVSLSEQQLVDCNTLDAGCDGGQLDASFPYIEKYGLESESDYPYTAKDGSCKYDSSKVVTKVSSYKSLSHDETALQEALANHGPVSVAIDATYLSSYSSGVYTSTKCSARGLNHGVLVVGYGTESGKKYWIVKNSWGASWGEKGYFKLLRGANECGVAEDNVYPVIN